MSGGDPPAPLDELREAVGDRRFEQPQRRAARGRDREVPRVAHELRFDLAPQRTPALEPDERGKRAKDQPLPHSRRIPHPNRLLALEVLWVYFRGAV